VLLNQDGQETDVYGEIAICSPYVAIGYWRQPELTRTAFDPATEAGGARRYHTGDMGRRRCDGSLEFVGRKDTQVKIRGHRIELREIETTLAQHQLVAEAVVLHRDDGSRAPYLVGYVRILQEHSVSPAGLRDFLRERLPQYMIPTLWVQMDSLPLLPNGKVDRKALPEPDSSLTELVEEFVPPRNSMEITLARIWESLLEIERVGVHNNFFDLGGHSLLATRVVSRIQQEFHVDLKLAHFFEIPTIAELAERLEALLWINTGRPSQDEAESQEREKGSI
jgi:surfactin family lipopeptide synthetase C